MRQTVPGNGRPTPSIRRSSVTALPQTPDELLARERAFVSFISGLAARVLSVPPRDLHPSLTDSFERLRELLDIDRMAFWWLEQGQARRVMIVARAGIRGDEVDPEYDVNTSKVFLEPLARATPFAMSTASLPAGSAERRMMETLRFVSLIVVPIQLDGGRQGALVAGSLTSEIWSEDQLQHLRLVGQLFAGAMARRDDEALIEASGALNDAILQSLVQHVAVVDAHGRIVKVNASWAAFARANDGNPDVLGAGADYLAVCRRAARRGSVAAKHALEGIESVLRGERDNFITEYECHSPAEQRWFGMTVTPLRHPAGGVVIAHRNITARKKAEMELRGLSRRLLTAQEQERRRIALELHDRLGQQLALASMEVDQLRLSLTTSRTKRQLGERLAALSDQIANISSDVHRLSHRLHPAKLEALGLPAALKELCREMSTQGTLDATFTPESSGPALDQEGSSALFGIAQEALTNVVKHSGARQVAVSLSAQGRMVLLAIEDDGCGFDPDDRMGSGLGLVSMRERAHLARGTLAIRSAPGKGTRIEVFVPAVPRASAASEGETRA